MSQLVEYQNMAENFLSTLGDGNWIPFGSNSSGMARPMIDDNMSLLERYLGDLLSTLLTALENRAKALKAARSQIAPIFLLNNIAYLRREILSSNIGDILGEYAEDDLNKRNRSSKAGYLELFSGLIASIMDPTANAAAIGKFNDALNEVENIHRIARLDAGEEEMRDRLKSEVEKMIIPTYSKFASRNEAALMKNPKFALLDVASVQARLDALFA